MHRIPLLKQNTSKHDDYHHHHHRPRDKDHSSVLRIRSALAWHGMANQSKYQCSGCEKASKLTYYLSSVIFRVWRAKTQGDSWFRVFIEPMTTRCSFNTKVSEWSLWWLYLLWERLLLDERNFLCFKEGKAPLPLYHKKMLLLQLLYYPYLFTRDILYESGNEANTDSWADWM